MLMAFCASAFDPISTNANPLERPVSRSMITVTDSTAPDCSNRVRRSSSVVAYDRFPTYSLFSMSSPDLNDGPPGLDACDDLLLRSGALGALPWPGEGFPGATLY